MINKKEYDRLMPEYLAGHSEKYNQVTDVSKFLMWIIIGALAYTALSVVIALTPPVNSKSISILIIVPIIAAVLIITNLRENAKWKESGELVRATVAAYECAVTDCAGYYKSGGRGRSSTHLIFKFTYNKDGAVITDMCRMWMNGIYKGDLGKTQITLYETRGGGKIISLTPQGKREHRIIV